MIRDVRVSSVQKDVSCRADPSRIDKEASVLIVGTGLSMADVVVSLAKHGHEGKVTAISRRGIIPKSHDTGRASRKRFFIPGVIWR